MRTSTRTLALLIVPVLLFALRPHDATGGEVVNLATTQPQILIRGGAPGDQAGQALAIGDINRDFNQELIVGVPLADELGRPDAGKAYVVYGSQAFPPNHSLTLAASNLALTVTGHTAGDHLGYAVAAGDVNGDTVDDFIVSAVNATTGARINAGLVYVLYGTVFLGSQNQHDLATTPADITIRGRTTGDRLGKSLACADVNGDGIKDIIMGAPDANGRGRVFIVYGSNAFGANATIDLLGAGANVTISGRNVGDSLGTAVAAGDVNGDNIADIILGAPNAELTGEDINASRGEVYIIYGSNSLPAAIDLSTDSPDVELVGSSLGDQLGAALALSNMNGTGPVDLAVGAPQKDLTWRENVGAVYVFYGGTFNTGEVRTVNNTTADYTIYGDTPQDSFGSALAAGDANGDTIGDLFIGAKDGDYYFQENRGKAYVVYGGANLGNHAILDLDIAEAPLLVMGEAPSLFLGTAVAAVDLDRDGKAELAASSPLADPENLIDKGAIYVVSSDHNTPLDAQIISHNIPVYWYPGQKRFCSVNVKNTGLTTWNNTTPIQLGPPSGSDPFSTIVRYDPDHIPVRHGDVATFVLEMTAPAASAIYTTQWQAVGAGNNFFGQTLSANLTVVKKGMDSVPVGSTVPVAINADSALHPVTLSYMNVGTADWKADSLFELKTTQASEPFAMAKTSSAPAAPPVRLGDVMPFPFDFRAPAGTGWQGTAWQTHRPTLRWFGLTFVDHMAWNNIPRWATLQGNTVPKRVTVGTGFTFNITVSNDGSVTWNNTNNILLGAPTNSVAPFTGPIRWSMDSGDVITTGQYKTFPVTLTAPQTPGIYPLKFRMLHPGLTWFGETFPFTIEVVTDPSRDAIVSFSRVPEVVTAGSNFDVTLEFTNNGRKTWLEDRGYRLTAAGSNSPFTAPSTVLLNTGEIITSGSKRSFTFNVTAPGSPGDFTLAYRMTQSSGRDFGQIAKFPIKVVSVGLGARVISHTIPKYIGRNETINVEVVMRNEGTTPWTRTGQKNLGYRGTQAPFTIANRQALRVGEVVNPGDTTCFYFPIIAPLPLPLITKTLTFQMVHDGGAGFYGEQLVKDITVLGTLYDAKLVSLSYPSQVAVNQQFNIVITMRNRGSRFWNRPDDYNLNILGVDPAPFIGSARHPIAPYVEVEFDQTYTFTIPLKAPSTPGGPHTLNFQMVDIGVRYFGDIVPVTINVAASKPGLNKAEAQSSAPASYYVLDSAGTLHALNGGSLAGVDLSNVGAVSAAHDAGSVLVLDSLGSLYDVSEGPLDNNTPGLPVARDVEFIHGTPAILDAFGEVHGEGVPAGQYFGWDIARDLAATPEGDAYILDGLGGVHPLAEAPAVDAAYLGVDAAVSLALLEQGLGGYVLDSLGNVHPFGQAADLGSVPLTESAAVDLKLANGGAGYYILDDQGSVAAYGDAQPLESVELPEGVTAVKLLAVEP